MNMCAARGITTHLILGVAIMERVGALGHPVISVINKSIILLNPLSNYHPG